MNKVKNSNKTAKRIIRKTGKKRISKKKLKEKKHKKGFGSDKIGSHVTSENHYWHFKIIEFVSKNI